MISINDAVANNVEYLRRPIWANPKDYLKLDIIDGKLGPWLRLYSPMNEQVNGRNPVDLLCMEFDLDKREYEIWQVTTGPHWVNKDGKRVDGKHPND